ncbi:MAG: lysostaphin resistance A-like protein [Gemmatimonadales bacterium]
MTAVTIGGFLLLDTARPGRQVGLIEAAAIQAVAGIAVYGGLTWLIGRRILRLEWRELGWAGRRDSWLGFRRGFLVAGALAVVALVAGLPAGSSWAMDGGALGAYLERVALLALVLLPPAFMEELAFRGLAVTAMARGIGRGPALVLTSVGFAAAHFNNPDVTPLGLGNIALAGVFLGLTFFARGGIATATGAHLGWNLLLAALAAPVSGLPFDIPWIDFHPGRPAWFTGGGFGPEGGILATVALSIGSALAVRWHFEEAQ